MKITVGVKSIKEAGYFLDSGADEVYCGLIELHNNRLPHENFSAPSDVEEVIGLAHSRGKKSFIAANEIIHERSGVTRYFFKYGDKISDIAWGNTREEVYNKAKGYIDAIHDDSLNDMSSKFDLITSFCFIEGEYGENGCPIDIPVEPTSGDGTYRHQMPPFPT